MICVPRCCSFILTSSTLPGHDLPSTPPNLALVLFAWWSIAWFILTFVGPATGVKPSDLQASCYPLHWFQPAQATKPNALPVIIPDTRCLVLNTIHTPPSIPFPAIGPFAGLSQRLLLLLGRAVCRLDAVAERSRRSSPNLWAALSPLCEVPAPTGLSGCSCLLRPLQSGCRLLWHSDGTQTPTVTRSRATNVTMGSKFGRSAWASCQWQHAVATSGWKKQLPPTGTGTFALGTRRCVQRVRLHHTRSRYPHNDTDLRTLASMMPLARPCTYMGIAPS